VFTLQLDAFNKTSKYFLGRRHEKVDFKGFPLSERPLALQVVRQQLSPSKKKWE
jgi:hypothetical protein